MCILTRENSCLQLYLNALSSSIHSFLVKSFTCICVSLASQTSHELAILSHMCGVFTFTRKNFYAPRVVFRNLLFATRVSEDEVVLSFDK